MFSACKYLYSRSRFCKLLVHPRTEDGGNGREGKGEQGKGKERKVRAGEGRGSGMEG